MSWRRARAIAAATACLVAFPLIPATVAAPAVVTEVTAVSPQPASGAGSPFILRGTGLDRVAKVRFTAGNGDSFFVPTTAQAPERIDVRVPMLLNGRYRVALVDAQTNEYELGYRLSYIAGAVPGDVRISGASSVTLNGGILRVEGYNINRLTGLRIARAEAGGGFAEVLAPTNVTMWSSQFQVPALPAAGSYVVEGCVGAAAARRCGDVALEANSSSFTVAPLLELPPEVDRPVSLLDGGAPVTIRGRGFTGIARAEVLTGSSEANDWAPIASLVVTDSQMSGITTAAVGTPPILGLTRKLRLTDANGRQFIFDNGQVVRYSNPPTLVGVDPFEWKATVPRTFTVIGTNLQSTSRVTVGGVDAPVTARAADGQSVTATKPANLLIGTHDVQVRTALGDLARPRAVRVVPDVSILSAVEGPAAGGTRVVITGGGAGNFAAAGQSSITGVFVGDVPAVDVQVLSPTQIAFTTAAVASHTQWGRQPITVRSVDVDAEGGPGFNDFRTHLSFTYLPVQISQLSPSRGPLRGGTGVVATGSGFDLVREVRFAGEPVTSLVKESDSRMRFLMPASVAAGPVSPTIVHSLPAGQGVSQHTLELSNVSFTYAARPQISAVTPDHGPITGGTRVEIAGTGFTAASRVSIGGANAVPFTVVSDARITATLPSSAQAGVTTAVVSTPGGISQGFPFRYDNAPRITGLSPSTGPVAGGTRVVIRGENLADAGKVWIGGRSVVFSQISATRVAFTTPPGQPYQLADVSLRTPLGIALEKKAFAYGERLPIPVITVASPQSISGLGGAAVELSGSGFTAATAVAFSGRPASSFEVMSDGRITAVAPQLEVGQTAVTVTGPAGTSEPSAPIRVVATGLPVIASASRTTLPVTGGVTTTVTGSNLCPADGGLEFALLGEQDITNLVRCTGDPGVIDVRTPQLGSVGKRQLVIITGAGRSNAFMLTFEEMAPQITSVSPSRGCTACATAVGITVENPQASIVSVTFGGALASYLQRPDGSISATAPYHDEGVVDVTVTYNSGVSATAVGAFEYTTPPPPVYVAAPQVEPTPATLALTSISPTTMTLTGGVLTLTGTAMDTVTEVRLISSDNTLNLPYASGLFTSQNATTIVFNTHTLASGKTITVRITDGQGNTSELVNALTTT